MSDEIIPEINFDDIDDENLLTRHEFFFELPLYTPVKIEDLEEDFEDFFDDDVDAYNPDGFDTTYEINRHSLDYVLNNGFYAIELECRRKGNTLYYIVFSNNVEVVKIGQFPSLADLQFTEIGKKYDKILSKQDLHDFKKAIGLMAHGTGAGSLVYLRRIFENTIYETYEMHKDVLNITKEDFNKKRMDEKVSFLKRHLPSELVEMKKIYSILSIGIHQLSEKDCLTYFPALKLSIELILDQKIEEKKNKKRKSKIKSTLDEIAKQIKGRDKK